MTTILYILAVLASVLLILIVLIQNPKGGGIAANFSAANQIAGVKKTNDFVEKATWTLAIVLLLFSLGSSFISSSTEEELQESIMQEQLENSTTAPEQLAPVGDPGLDPSATPQQNGGSAPMQSTDNPSEE